MIQEYKKGCELFVVGCFRNSSEVLINFVQKDAHDYLVLIVKVEESECQLDSEILVSTNIVTRYIDIGETNLLK